MLAHPKRGGGWEVINGALEANETVLEGALRETREEAGEPLRVRPLGTAHVSTFHYDDNVRYMLSISYVMAYEGGEVVPGDDMTGSLHRWWSADELMSERAKIIVPPDGLWLIKRAIELYRLWRGQTVELQPPLHVPRDVKAR